MTTQQTVEPISETDALAFLTKLNAWAQELPATERTCLDVVLLRAAAADNADVEGFLMKAQPYEPGVRPVPSPDGGGNGGTPLDLGSINVIMPGITLGYLAQTGGTILSNALGLP